MPYPIGHLITDPVDEGPKEHPATDDCLKCARIGEGAVCAVCFWHVAVFTVAHTQRFGDVPVCRGCIAHLTARGVMTAEMVQIIAEIMVRRMKQDEQSAFYKQVLREYNPPVSH